MENRAKRKLPAEWEEQDGVLLAWPHEGSDWKPILQKVVPVFVDIVSNICRFEQVVIVAPDPAAVRKNLLESDVPLDRVRIIKMPTNDTWARDFGPISVMEDGSPIVLDFGFNGWGLKFPAEHDNRINRRLRDEGIWRCPFLTPGLILEGGSIDSDGNGTILTTATCLLNENRNPHLDKHAIEQSLADWLGVDRFLWLTHGYLSGDDTDSHVDTLARLCPHDTIIHVACDDQNDEHFPELSAMTEELAAMTTRNGQPYRLIPLPWPKACYDATGNRLPATYANFLVINSAVLVPTYGDEHDKAALAAVAKAFPNREIVGIDCLPLILQHGSLHCLTMQLPRGVLTDL